MKPQINYIYDVQDIGGKAKLTWFSENYQFCHFDILSGEHKGKVLCREYFEVESWAKQDNPTGGAQC